MGKHYALVILLLLCFPLDIMAQLPVTHLYRSNFIWKGDSLIIQDVTFLSAYNPKGYNNQVHFIDSDSFYVVSNVADSSHTDIWLGSFSNSTLTRVTGDGTAYYSPAVSPDRQWLYAVRVIQKEPAIQQLQRSSVSAMAQFSPVMVDSTVGYFAIKNLDSAYVFTVGNPNQLWLYFLNKNQSPVHICDNPGRSLHFASDGALLYIHEVAPNTRLLKSFNGSYVDKVIVQIPNDVEDFTIDSSGNIWCAQGSKLKILDQTQPGLSTWRIVADLAYYGLLQIKRLSISPDGSKIIFVNYE